jgi:uncharacterized protein (TIGR03067 family)
MKPAGLLIGTVVVLLAADLPKENGPARDIDKLQGTWMIRVVETSGKVVEGDRSSNAPGELMLNGNHYTLKLGELTNTGTFRLDPERSPKTVDVIPSDGPNKGRTFPGIYRIEGEIMKSCFNVGDGKRPTRFTTKDQPGWIVVEQRRIK